MADPTATPGVTAEDKTPDQIEREMLQTRESLTNKVAALETQVLGTIQTATNTLTDTVQTVKEAVTTAPAAVKDTVQETVAAVKDSVKETLVSVKDTVASFSLSDTIRDNPVAALGVSVGAGLAVGLLLPTARSSRPLMARGPDLPAPGGHLGGVHTAYAAPPAPPSTPGIFGGLMGMVGGQVQELARQALSTAVDSLKKSLNDRVPRLMDDAVQSVASRVTAAVDPSQMNGGYHPPAASRYPTAPGSGF